ncbi:hypothetical protein [Sulfuritalea hydrogenivorans]|uniref:hypothetical protein n=1 Tax=Sulfuritalea hydrogenivorans TaxID=748811 RepID=UPI001E617947|nr:hypothetical protein [Sulfuritalea hydrogenivorans]
MSIASTSSSGQRVFQRPARLQRVGKAAHGRFEALAHGRGFVRDHAGEALAVVRFHVRRVDQRLHRGADVGQRRAVAVGQKLQDLVALGFAFEIARDVFDGQDVTRHLQFGAHRIGSGQCCSGRILIALATLCLAKYRCHLRPEQLPPARGSDEIGRRFCAALAQALLDFLQ